MSRNTILLIILGLMTVGFAVLLFLLTKAPALNRQPNNINQTQTERLPVSITQVPAGPVVLLLEPFQAEISQGEVWKVSVSYQNLEANIQAADLILAFDPTLFEFVAVENLNLNYLNPRTMVKDNRLILSFVEKQEQTEISQEVKMADLIFRPKRAGKATLKPVFELGGNGSQVMVANNDKNQLSQPTTISATVK